MSGNEATGSTDPQDDPAKQPTPPITQPSASKAKARKRARSVTQTVSKKFMSPRRKSRLPNRNKSPKRKARSRSPKRRARSPKRQSRSSSSSSTSSSSSSTSSSSSSSSGSPSDSRRRKHKKTHTRRRRRSHRRHCKKNGKSSRRSYKQERRLAELTREVNQIKKQQNTPNFCNDEPGCPSNYCQDDAISIDDNVSRDLYTESDTELNEAEKSGLQLNFDLQTKLKDPPVPKASEQMVNLLQGVQYFEKSDWCEVRYAEVQKLYNQTPGFIELEANEEIRAYDQLRHLAYADKAYAALTLCVLKQREALQNNLQELLIWARDTNDLNVDTLHEKINVLFAQGEYSKVSADLLQLVCGHRAEVIQMRRDGITNFVRDPLVKSTIRKVPPSNRCLFSAETLTTALEKAGGVKKAFLSPIKPATASTSQVGTSKAVRHPPQGSTCTHGPSQGTSHGCCARTHQSSNSKPSQGCYTLSRPSQGYGAHNQSADRRTGHSTRGSFRSQRGRQNYKPQYQTKGNRKRGGPPTGSNSDNKKRKF
ncbi:hypothetical protein O0L34_g11171 [Tuta absoluta]|nr:hypothetical protein O0L34_g11171 [Tuta absoluta]